MAGRRKIPAATHEEFVFHARAPSLSYSFGIEHDRQARKWRPFAERETLQFKVECIWPERFKGRVGDVTIYPEPAYADHQLLQDDDVRRGSVGYIRATKAAFEVVVYLPPPAYERLGPALASGLVRSMLTNGLVDTRGMNRVTWASFRGQDFDPVEYVG